MERKEDDAKSLQKSGLDLISEEGGNDQNTFNDLIAEEKEEEKADKP